MLQRGLDSSTTTSLPVFSTQLRNVDVVTAEAIRKRSEQIVGHLFVLVGELVVLCQRQDAVPQVTRKQVVQILEPCTPFHRVARGDRRECELQRFGIAVEGQQEEDQLQTG